MVFCMYHKKHNILLFVSKKTIYVSLSVCPLSIDATSGYIYLVNYKVHLHFFSILSSCFNGMNDACGLDITIVFNFFN